MTFVDHLSRNDYLRVQVIMKRKFEMLQICLYC